MPKDLWPGDYVRKYDIDNLWKYDLPNAWRLIYTISKDEIKILAILLEWFDHKKAMRRGSDTRQGSYHIGQGFLASVY